MAAMTVTYTVVASWRLGNRRFRRVTAAFDGGNYAGGGIAITAADCDLADSIDTMVEEGKKVGYSHWYDRANGMIEIWYGDNNNAADGPLVENAAAAMTVHTASFLVIGW